MLNKNILMTVVFALIAVVLPLVIKAPYQQHILILVLIWATIGTAGIFSVVTRGRFRSACRFWRRRYSAGILTLHYSLSPWWGLILGP